MEKTYGLRAIKLTDISIEERMRAARYAARHLCSDESDGADVLAAALFPSEKTYWVREQAVTGAELLAAA